MAVTCRNTFVRYVSAEYVAPLLMVRFKLVRSGVLIDLLRGPGASSRLTPLSAVIGVSRISFSVALVRHSRILLSASD